ncbi:uncharacterized protein BDW43DRAFT_305685 [Aspergillus alliaceus]|uniref:uncharacterized protein n=1 Tax=Petromyces alliaceus TaxID=209559 RepID=UPI0012A594C1|nr:uncharacterized protein BDW43DRAFT_305685 [Aspergillus alliaceus]KAB8238783.1 hypothetical protein BDW43DRAFT_305685 [Aspergillus alliaceus]
MYHTLWADGNPAIAQEEGFMPLLVNGLGADIAKEVLDASRQSEIKERLAGNMQKAFDRGAFGLPWFECVNVSGEKEGFWGVDHIGRVMEFLGLERCADVAF